MVGERTPWKPGNEKSTGSPVLGTGRSASARSKFEAKPRKSAEDLTASELLRWNPGAETSQATAADGGLWPKGSTTIASSSYGNAIFSSPRQKASLPPKPKPAPAAGTYQFAPFAFGTSSSVAVPAEVSKPPDASPAVEPMPLAPEMTAMVTQDPGMPYDSTHTEQGTSESTGGSMVDLSGYKDLTQPPVNTGEGQGAATSTLPYESATETEYKSMNAASTFNPTGYSTHPEMAEHEAGPGPGDYEVYGEYSGNVKTLVQLVNDLPEGVTKQTGAQIIRLTMEAMGISMESVLSDAQAVQSQLLDAVRSNIKKIEEYKTIIRKLESEIRFHQGKANELSEIIDLFILSNTSPNMPAMDRNSENNY